MRKPMIRSGKIVRLRNVMRRTRQATAMPVVDKKLTAAGQLAARLRCRCSSSISAT
jgi:hypothetical protein